MYLEDVIVATIAVPELAGALVSETELQLGAHLHLLAGELELEAELVGGALAAARHVLRVSLPHAAPPVRAPPHRHRLDMVIVSGVKRSIGFTIGFYNHGEGKLLLSHSRHY